MPVIPVKRNVHISIVNSHGFKFSNLNRLGLYDEDAIHILFMTDVGVKTKNAHIIIINNHIRIIKYFEDMRFTSLIRDPTKSEKYHTHHEQHPLQQIPKVLKSGKKVLLQQW